MVNKLPLAGVPIFNVPVPENVPLRVKSAFPSAPTVGLVPRGKLQLLLTVLVTEPVCAKATRLKVTLLQLSVDPFASSNVTVPELWLKVGEPDMVNSSPTIIVPDDAVNMPPVSEKLSSISRVCP